MPDGGKAGKNQLRKTALARRDALPISQRIEKSLAMADAAGRISFDPGTVISGFLPIRSEPDLRPLMAALRDRGARLCLPVVLDRETIVFRDFVRGEGLVDTGFGTVGPGEGAEVLDPDIMLMPLAGFDAAGNRLGYGAGHYDRAIARLRVRSKSVRLIGTAFETQFVEAIPAEDHDVPLDELITETGLRSFSTRV
ncbi:5-formyltetrahydrofolate cyclo-ligase [Pseudohoeflea suaedae]|uniref:5-formyltetrahydrofolate cyclo-ligase n=1 Tax=Pseudohoeflea suaedae TaxID=877384 RepID=A0A4R5PIW1_9HYPH|nr:5-formyltetrahydrofolate cyclo-ligase [Pseudohoeflea suaedae]TDH35101.1 5-formyltetrahydrofolate cyclo-ligase [Pseudohoeflea suaedae]